LAISFHFRGKTNEIYNLKTKINPKQLLPIGEDSTNPHATKKNRKRKNPSSYICA
jgi:hypothetical protein